MGESSKVPAVAAVANAVFNAIGRRMKDLPITSGQDHRSTGMKAFTNANPRDLAQALRSDRAGAGRAASTRAIAGGGSDLLGMIKERIVSPDVLVQSAGDQRDSTRSWRLRGGLRIGGLMTLDT